jgi:D-aminopeptidase
MKYIASITLLVFVTSISEAQSRKRARDYGIKIGVLAPGKFNAITDVKGLTVGHTTIHRGNDIHTGATAILPHSGNIFQDALRR